MAGETHAAEAAHQQVDIIGHLLDHQTLEVPFLNASHLLDGELHLPQFDPIYGIDLSITRHVVMMWVASALLIGILWLAFRRRALVPGRLGNFFETIVVFLRDEVVMPTMGAEGRAYLPYLLTAFFFILSCNLLGLVPYAATATGNVNVTAALALMTFLLTLAAGVQHNGLFGYCKSLIPHGLPVWLLPIMIPVELVSMFSRPFALCIRLFANMIAGHMVILVFLGIIILLKALWLAPFSVAFAAAIYLLEIFIAFVQAFIFTLLSTLFISMAAHPQH
ncbi:MAG: F0F1 ATP synthase subunit A [Candidatus Latescibacteria bacterium]|nr:F0F1 ATP synthase subunit A [Candidatus Latescibacterota bacterium]